VFLKEFLPDARPVAMNELQTLRHLQGHLPLRKWHAATAAVTTHQPFVPLLGGSLLLHAVVVRCTSQGVDVFPNLKQRDRMVRGASQRNAAADPAKCPIRMSCLLYRPSIRPPC